MSEQKPRRLAKRYLRSLGELAPPKTERECLEMLIASHMTLRAAAIARTERAEARGWFGRFLWRLFERWL